PREGIGTMPFFIGSHGRIHHEAWLPDGDVTGIVVFCHGGVGQHRVLYHSLHALGDGRSDGERDFMESWDWYVDDARTLANLALAQHPDRPLVLMGHSGGGLAALLLAQRSPQLAQALVVSAPPAQPIPWVVAEFEAGGEGVESPDPSEMFSTHPDYVEALRHDPLVSRGP